MISQMTLHYNDLHEKTGRLAEKASRVGLKLYARKCKTLWTGCASRRENIVVHGEKVNDVEGLRQRRCNWLGHILRREGENNCFTALGLAPKGLRTRGRPKTTRKRTVGKQTWVEGLGSRKSGCRRQKPLVRQRGENQKHC